MTIPAAHSATILIIEDDPAQVRAYSKVLRGYRLTVVPTGTAALESLASHIPDLIILDNVLAGGEQGLDFLPRIKHFAAHVPVVLISGTLDLRRQLAALQGPLSAHYMIEKPADVTTLTATVETALTECGFAEVVAALQSIERGEKDAASDPDRRFTERLARQHQLLRLLRYEPAAPVNVSALARACRVDRKTIRRDLADLVRRGQLDAWRLPATEV